MKVCLECGKEFQENRCTQKYCCRKCQKRAAKRNPGTSRVTKENKSLDEILKVHGYNYGDYQKQKTLQMVGRVNVNIKGKE